MRRPTSAGLAGRSGKIPSRVGIPSGRLPCSGIVLIGWWRLIAHGFLSPCAAAVPRCRFAALRAPLFHLGALRSFGSAFRFLLQRTLARGFAGGGCRADARNEMKVLAAFNLLASSAGAVQGCGLGAVIVVAAEIDFSPVGRGGVSGGMPTGLPGPASTSTSATG